MPAPSNIIPHNHSITIRDRIRIMGHRPAVVWFTGLSGSGKSTLAGMLETTLAGEGIHTYILDGDNIRTGLNKDLDFSPDGRTENIRRIAEVARLMADAGLVVITAFISPYAADRALAREIIGDDLFTEVFVNCPLEVCEARDVKGLYARARAGSIPNFTGISAPFETPEQPHVIVRTHEATGEACIAAILTELQPKLKSTL